MIEIWKDVLGYEGLYEVSSLGSVRCISRRNRNGVFVSTNKKLKTWLSKGYPQIGLYKDGMRKGACIHVLVAEAFIGPRSKGMEVCHNDGNPLNNNIDNLRWASRIENHADKKRHGTNLEGSLHPNAKLTEEQVINAKEAAAAGQTHRSIAARLGVTRGCISVAIAGKSWRHVL